MNSRAGTVAPRVVFDGRVLRLGHEGLAVHLALWIRALARHWGHDQVRVLVPDDVRIDGNRIPLELLHRVAGRGPRTYVLREVYWAHRIARERQSVYPQSWFLVSAPWYAGPVPPRTLVWLHDCIERHWAPARATWSQRAMRAMGERRMRRRAWRVLAISQWARTEGLRWLGLEPARVEVVSNFVRPDLHAPVGPQEVAAVRERHRLPAAYIAYLGGFRAYKQVDCLVAAWSAARQRSSVPPLVIAGAVPQHDRRGYFTTRETILRLAGSSRSELVLPGPLDDADLRGFYAGASLFVAPSAHEGFGFPLAEAMACGAPVLASEAPAFTELLPPSARRFPTGAIGELQIALLQALQMPEQHRHPLPPHCFESAGVARLEQVLAESQDPWPKQ
jgi:glycosyltransferase involved in cell wall biosynthesis